MSIAVFLESLNGIVVIVSAVATASATLYGAWQSAKKKKYAESFELSEKALLGVAAALESAPAGSNVSYVKNLAQAIAEALDTQGPKLANLAADIQELFAALGLNEAGSIHDTDTLRKIANAVKSAQQARTKKV